ncbi:hypothetical protein WMF17_44085 [Sorangium sp. So ce362]
MARTDAELPEVMAFYDDVLKNISSYRLFPQENFTHYILGVLATSSVDAHGDVMAEEALTDMVLRVQDGPLWSLAEHNPIVQPIGRVIAAKKFYSPADAKHVVVGVVGTYDLSQLPTFADVGLTDDGPSDHLPTDSDPSDTDHFFQLGLTRHDLSPDMVADLLASAPSLVSRDVDRRVRKTLNVETVISILLPSYLLLKTPFLQKFGERLGDKAADSVLESLTWVKTKLARAVDAHSKREVLYELTIRNQDCTIQFLIDTKDLVIVEEAIEKLPEAVQRAGRLLVNGAHLEMDKLVYLYDRREGKRWIPLHAASRKRGVISDRPYLVSLDSFKGFSVEGSVVEQLLPPKGEAEE